MGKQKPGMSDMFEDDDFKEEVVTETIPTEAKEIAKTDSNVSLASVADVEQQIATAKKYRRSLKKCLNAAEQMALVNKDIAASCYYKLPRGGKTIEGKSVRLAEIMANSWTNFKYAARIIAELDDKVIAQGVAWDMETNVSVSVEISRRITDSKGRRYNPDMINVTCLAAIAIAGRNAIFKIIPGAYSNFIYDQCKKVAVGEKKGFAKRKKEIISQLLEMGIEEDRICELVNKESIVDIDANDLEDLIGFITAVNDNIITIEYLQTGIEHEGRGKPKVNVPQAKNGEPNNDESN